MQLKLDHLSKAVSVDRIENGAWLHFELPVKSETEERGDLFYLPIAKGPDAGKPDKSKPVRALVRSHRSKVFRSKEFKIQTDVMSKTRRAKERERDGVLEKQMELERPRKFAVLLVALDNASAESPGIQHVTEEDAIALAGMSEYQWLVDQVMDFAFTDDNFGGFDEEGKALAPQGNAGGGEDQSAETSQP